MLSDFTTKGKLSEFKAFSRMFIATFCLAISSYQVEATQSAQKEDFAESSLQSSCKRDGCDSKSKHRDSDSQVRRNCCPGPKGPKGDRGPEGNPACPGIFTDFASYQLILAAGDTPITLLANTIISFQRPVAIRGHSISSYPPFNTFEVVAGIYEISAAFSNQNAAGANAANGLTLAVGSKNFTFPAGDVNDDIITYRKIIQVFLPTDIAVKTTTGVTFTPPIFTGSPGDNAGLAAYINIVRIQ